MIAEVRGTRRRSVLAQIFRRCRHHAPDGCQPTTHETGIGCLGNSHGDIETFINRFGETIVQGELDNEFAILDLKVGDGGAHMRNPEEHGRAYPLCPARFRMQALH